MIAKKIARKSASQSSIKGLVVYMMGLQKEPSLWQRDEDFQIQLPKATTYGDRVASYRVMNCETEDLAEATYIIQATQNMNTRSQTDKVYHLVFSFAPDEHPPLETIHQIEDELCYSLGYAQHQRISVVHQDTENLHVHVAINKVHPTEFQNIEPFYDHYKLMETCEALEIKYGLERTFHGDYASTGTPSQKSFTTYGALQTLTDYIREEVVQTALQSKTWQDLHQNLGEYGLEIKPRGAGLVIGDPEKNIWTKASTCHKDLSMKPLTEKLGNYEKPLESQTQPQKKKTYSPNPDQKTPQAEQLFQDHQRYKQKALTYRKQELDRLKQENEAFKHSLKTWAQGEKGLLVGKTKKAMAQMIYERSQTAQHQQMQAYHERKQMIMSRTTVPVWRNWLAEQAKSGNESALQVLRQRQKPLYQNSENVVRASEEIQGNLLILKDTPHNIRADGSIRYTTKDGGVVFDKKEGLHAKNPTDQAVLLALQIAEKRFTNQLLTLQGTSEFQQKVIRLTTENKLNLIFKNPPPQIPKTPQSTNRGMEF